ncbi:HAD family hydrolase [Eggerthellaceae bacterium zg-893]|nr:HAD family hydrolase [Eggerthellaceae bacterium zg-893]
MTTNTESSTETVPKPTGGPSPDANASAPAPATRSYRAVCFDLDGTLLPLDLDVFLQRYFSALGKVAVRSGADPSAFKAGMDAGVRAMATHDDGCPNDQAFWRHFFAEVDPGACDWNAVFAAFYERSFGEIGADVVPDPAAARAVETLRKKGYPLALTTMPMFPIEGVKWRLTWAGVDADAFVRITAYDNSTATKPHAIYYAENLAALGVDGKDVLMVGNNTVEDLSFMQLGADAFLVTDYMLNPSGMDVNEVRHGTLAEFADWVETLPTCENPAVDVRRGLIAREESEAVLVKNERAALRDRGVRR